jgi:hypothetical protein
MNKKKLLKNKDENSNEIERILANMSDSSSSSSSSSSSENLRGNSYNKSKNEESSSSKKSSTNIDNRVEHIKEILQNNILKPIIDFDNCETENFTGGNNKEHNHNDETCNDIRCLLNKKLLDLKEVFSQMKVKLVYIKSGTTGHTFKATSKNDPNIVFAVKVVAYPKRVNYGNMYNAERPENAELMMIKLLSYFVVNHYTPHIVLPIGTFNTSILSFLKPQLLKSMESNPKKYNRFEKFVKKYQKKEFENYVSVLISEWADGGDLLDYIRNNYELMTLRDWKVIFFQLLSVLAVIQKKYPNFRHNDLKANNILIQHVNSNILGSRYKYVINGVHFIVPNIGIQIKLWDFDFACIPGIVDNAKVSSAWTKEINVRPRKNRYYDIHYFFNTLRKKEFFSHFYSDKVPKDVIDFVHRVIPEKYRDNESGNVTDKGRIIVNDEYLTPFDVLCNDPFFKKFRASEMI